MRLLVSVAGRSVLVREHEGHDAPVDGWVSGIRGVAGKIDIKVVDLEEHKLTLKLHGAEVVLAIRIIGFGEGIEAGNRLVDLEDQLRAECLNAGGDHDQSS